MKAKILHVLCEGHTEESFVKKVLAPYLQQFNIFPKAIILKTSRKEDKKGGLLKYSQVKRDLSNLFKQNKNKETEIHYFTTMFDFYALPHDFPGYEEAKRIQDVRTSVSKIEEYFSNDVNNHSFIPYIQLHEFEALLFVDIEKLTSEYPKSDKEIIKLKKETDKIGDPELINCGKETAPSKRIIKAIEDQYRYNKVQSGTSITLSIGLERLMEKCQHFREWIEKITALSD